MKINWGKIIIGSVSAIFILYALLLISLYFFGVSTSAKITSYRQEYGERNETIRNQYTYLYGYEFEVNGKLYSGNGQRIGNSVYIKDTANRSIPIKYLTCCPQLNQALDHSPIKSLLIFIGIGVLLFYFARKIK